MKPLDNLDTMVFVSQVGLCYSVVRVPLTKVFVSQDGKASSKLTSDVIKMVSSLPDAVEGFTGRNVREAIGKLTDDAG